VDRSAARRQCRSIRHFQSEIVKRARVSGYACKQVNVSGDERCVKGAIVIKGTYPG
jgi:hypothetical protein